MTDNRTYQTSHPWLTFSADLRKASPRLWIMLGECRAACGQVADASLDPEAARRIARTCLAKGVLASAAAAGNTLSEEEVLRHLDGDLELPLSRQYLLREVDNLIEGCSPDMEDDPGGTVPELSPERIRELNRLILRGLNPGEGIAPGELRDRPFPEGTAPGAPVEDLAHLLDRLCEWLNGAAFTGSEYLRITNAVIRAALAHLYLAWIRPFGAGNGRTARLLEYRILVSSGVPSVSAHLPGIHYRRTRAEYSRQIEHAAKSADVLPFILYAVQGFADGLREQLGLIRERQREIVWRSHLHDLFRGQTGENDLRRLGLILDLSRREESLPLSGVRLVSPEVARSYARKSERTLLRDLSYLRDIGLVEKTEEGWRARKEAVTGFGGEMDIVANSENREN